MLCCEGSSQFSGYHGGWYEGGRDASIEVSALVGCFPRVRMFYTRNSLQVGLPPYRATTPSLLQYNVCVWGGGEYQYMRAW